MALGNLFGSGSNNSKDLNNWSSPFVNPGQLNSSLSSLSSPASLLKGFTGGGLTGSYDPTGNALVTADANRGNLVSQLSGAFQDQATKLGQLLSTVAPGFSDARSAYLADNTNRAESAISDLSSNLHARRVLGSSFAQDAINRTSATYGAERAQTLPQIYMQELEATNNLLNQQHTASVNQFQTSLNESNLQAGIAGELSKEATSAISNATAVKAQILAGLADTATAQSGANARAQAEIDAKSTAGAGSFFGTLLTPLMSAITGPVGGAITSALTGALSGSGRGSSKSNSSLSFA